LSGVRVLDLAAPGQPVTTLKLDLQAPYGILPAGDGSFYVTDTGRKKLYQLTLPVTLKEIASPGQTAITNYFDLALDGKGGLIVTDWEGQSVGRVDLADPNHPITQLVGAGRPDGLTPGNGAALDQPLGVVFAPDGSLVVTENFSNRLWTLPASGPPQLLAGWTQSAVIGDGFYVGAGFRQPAGLALDLDGSLLVADTNAERVRRVRLMAGGGVVSTVAGSGPVDAPGYADGPGAAARFAGPKAVAVGPDGTIYVGESGRIRTIKR
jgi:sugar lactone lactonase YvrE